MLSIGGVNPTTSSYQTAYNDPDPFWEGIKIFDMAKLQWTNYFNASAAPYTTPSAVTAHYAAGLRYPSKWGSNDLESLFKEPTVNSSASAKHSASASPRLGNQNKANRVAAVVGGAVGGVTAMLVSFALVLLARKRASQTTRKRNESMQPPTSRHGDLRSVEGMSEAGPASVHEADTRQFMPHEMDSVLALAHEADSGQDFVPEADPGQDFAHEADSGHLHELASPDEGRPLAAVGLRVSGYQSGSTGALYLG